MEKLLIALGPMLRAFANVGSALDLLRNELLELHEESTQIMALADNERRPLTPEEMGKLDAINARFDELEANIKLREMAIQQQEFLAASRGRQVPASPNSPAPGAQDAPAAVPSGDGRPRIIRDVVNVPRVPAEPRDGRWGWETFGHYALAVARASRPGQPIDQRLLVRQPQAALPGEFGREGVGEDGGYTVPPDFRSQIVQLVNGDASLLPRTDEMPTQSNSLTFPVDETTPWGTTGIQSFWDNEAEQLTPKKPSFKELTVRLSKLTTLVPVTDELMDDAPAMTAWLMKKAPDKMIFKINRAIVAGVGAGQPLGIMNSPALVTVLKESGQASGTLNINNIVKMYARMYAPCIPRSVWLVNQDVYPQLLLMAMTGAGGGIFPVFMPPGGASVAPYGTLMGRPIIPTEACESLSTTGDIIFADLTQYMSATKVGGIRSDVSMHLWFDFSITAFRFVFRVAGQPWWSSAVTPRSGSSNTLSPFVCIETR